MHNLKSSPPVNTRTQSAPLRYPGQLLNAPKTSNDHDDTEDCFQDPMNAWHLSTADALRVELRLNSLGDLERLLSAQFIGLTAYLHENRFQFNFPGDGDSISSRPCTLFFYNLISKPVKEITFKKSAKTPAVKRKLLDYLFHTYLSGCFVGLMHPDEASFLDSYYRNELEPALVYTATAFSAVHLLVAHPQAPIIGKLRIVIGEILTQAQQSLENIFDVPSPHAVLAFLNMENCMRWLGRFDDAYRFYSHAALMSLSLRLHNDDPGEHDHIQIEFRKRIWALIFKRELTYRLSFNKPALISLEIVKNSSKPTVNSNDRVGFKLFMLLAMMDVISAEEYTYLRDIDWSLPDHLIVHHVLSIAILLQKELAELKHYCDNELLNKYYNFDSEFYFWLQWCTLWQCFIKSNAPPGRLETDLMKQLREKALNEYIKGLLHSLMSLKTAISRQNWCKDYPFVAIQIICEKCKFISQTHPNIAMRRLVFQELAQVHRLLLSVKFTGIVERCLLQQIVETLEEMRPNVFSKKELENSNISKLRPLAIKPTAL
ncbi:uncharacterized protein VTP21DRAFT_10825 [Calcarisporiella thermophila]|uniref:uncharacterized protein n=1 Tax=Calcarisporiella thermophila TaxID=911321 RepID=UPI0037441219